MDPLILARWQFAITTVYHFFFVPLTLGLSVAVAIMETIYAKTGDETYLKMTKFWGKLFLINFVLGVATGIVQEFQFGMNWSQYSRFMGDIFGAPLAIEALLAFYLESTFLGVWIFGWKKLSKGAHAAVFWLVAIGSNLSALWILIANSFMQEPVGYVLRNGRAEMTNFFDLVFNKNVWVQWPHVFFAGMSTAAFLMIGISAYHFLKKSKDAEIYQKSAKFAAIYGTIGVLLVILNGHSQAQHMVESQPMKMAAAEALWETEQPASMSLFAIPSQSNQKDYLSVRVPYVLSILAHNNTTARVEGIKNIQQEYSQKYGEDNYIPPVFLSYWFFRIMVGVGFLMLIIVLYMLVKSLKKDYNFKPSTLKWLIWALLLPYIGNSTGWLFTEIGRQPWTVFGLLKTKDSVSLAVSGTEVFISLLVFVLVYAILIVANVYLLRKYAVAGVSEIEY